jgi:hypothetical protein
MEFGRFYIHQILICNRRLTIVYCQALKAIGIEFLIACLLISLHFEPGHRTVKSFNDWVAIHHADPTVWLIVPIGLAFPMPMPTPNIFQYVSFAFKTRRSLVNFFGSKLLRHYPGYFVIIQNLLGSKLDTLGDVALEARVASFQ